MATRPSAAIVTVGTELTTGHSLDTNGATVARALVNAGFDVKEMVSVPDDHDAIASAIRDLMSRRSWVIVTGGLGPTHDDVTREAAARALGRQLVRNSDLEAQLIERVRSSSEPSSRVSLLHQADIIDGAQVIPATVGTAPGQIVRIDGHTLVLLPGPPHEMQPMLESALRGRSAAAPPITLRCVGITESEAGERVLHALEGYPGIRTTLLGSPGEVEVILSSAHDDPFELEAAVIAAREALGDACYSSDGSTLPEAVVRLASARSAGIATAESCTGGLVAAAITDVPGSSEVFRGSVVAYADATKVALLGVDPSVLSSQGAVSEAVARAMAEGALDIPGVTLAVATTGFAGPAGGAPDKPVGTVWFALARQGSETTAETHLYGGDRLTIRLRARTTALDLLRRSLMER